MERIIMNALTLCILIFVLVCNFLFSVGISWTKYNYESYFSGYRCVPNETIFERFSVYDSVTCGRICYMTRKCLSYVYQPDNHQCIGCGVYGAIWTDHYDELPGSMYMASICDQKYIRVCYYQSEPQNPSAKYTPDKIDAKLCTHIIYHMNHDIVNNSRIIKPSMDDEDMFKRLQKLKVSNPCLKTLVGVLTETSSIWIDSREHRLNFIESAVSFLRTYGFNGLDSQPSAGETSILEDPQNLVRLVEEMKQTFDVFGYLLALRVPARKDSIDSKFDVKQLVENLDFIHVMTYNLYIDATTTGVHSPLYRRRQDSNDGEQLNMNWTAEYLISKGVPKKMLIISIATFGITFTLANKNENMVGAKVVGPGSTGRVITYRQICLILESGTGIERWDDEQKSPYYINGTFWVSYDNVRSISEKMYWLKEKGYGGALVFPLQGDDFAKKCKSSSRPYPLLSVVNDFLTSG